MPICNPTIRLVVANLYTKFEVSILNGCGDIFDKKIWNERKKNKYREEQIGEGPFSIPRYNLSVEVSILNGCGDIFDEKSGEKEKITNIGKNKQKAHFF